MDGGGGNGGGGGHSREYCLRWNNHQPNMVSFLSTLLPKESFADVTLVSAEGSRIQAHRIILSACSPYFEGVFESNPCKHPVVILKDVQFVDLRAIVNFIYNGEVNIEVDRINEIIQTATALQVKGLAEVPADEFKRVSLGGRCSSPVESVSAQQPSVQRNSQAPPPLIMSSNSIRSWPPNAVAEGSENLQDFPVRKKLKKSASANIPYSSGSSSTNGDATNSTGSSFESGVGTSVSRSVDEGIGSDISSNDQPSLRGPPPLTAAANAILPKSRSLDDGYQRAKNVNNVEVDASGYVEHGIDDNGLAQDGGYDELDGVVDGVNHHHPHAYLEEMDEDPEVDMSNYYDDETDQDYQEIFPKQETASFERPHVPLRKLLPKGNLNRKLNNNNNSTSNNNNNNGNAAAGNNRRQTVGVGHSLSLYRQQPLKNLASRAVIGKRRRGRPLLRQPRIKRLDNEPSPGGVGGSSRPETTATTTDANEQGYSSDTGEPYPSPHTLPRPASSISYEPHQQQQQHHQQQRSASVEHELYSSSGGSTATASSSNHYHSQQQHHNIHQRQHSPSPTPQQKPPTVPILRVSQCSPTPPGSPQPGGSVASPKSEIQSGSASASVASSRDPSTETLEKSLSIHQQQHHHLTVHQPGNSSPVSSSTCTTSSSTNSTTLLAVPTLGDPGSPSFTVRIAGGPGGGGGHLVKQVSQPIPLSHHHHYHSSEDEGSSSRDPYHHSHHHQSSSGSGSGANPVIRRQHSQPVQSVSRPYPNYSIVGRGQLFHILKSETFTGRGDEENAAYLVEAPMLQLVPSSTATGSSEEYHRQSPSAITFKEVIPIQHQRSTSSPQQSTSGPSGDGVSITLKEIGTSRSLSTDDREQRAPLIHSSTLPVSGSHSQVNSSSLTSMTSLDNSSSSTSATASSSSSGEPVHRSGHCPALRPGPALGCNFCWNSVDSCGRVLRRKTKYFCPECHINLCIVPCFQEYHEKSDRKKKPRTKLGLPKPSSM